MSTTVETLNPQHIFDKASDAPVPPAFAKRLIDLFGVDEHGSANVRVRFDDKRFLEGCWVVEEKWNASAFGDPAEWRKTQIYTDELGIRHDFGDFPSRGIYASVMVWCDHEGHTLTLNDDLIERLQFQKQQRESKNIPFETVVANTALKEDLAERQQAARKEEAVKILQDGIKRDKEKIIAASTREMSLPKVIEQKNSNLN